MVGRVLGESICPGIAWAIVVGEAVPYPHTFTYDILPASSTGTYVANGHVIGSTLSR